MRARKVSRAELSKRYDIDPRLLSIRSEDYDLAWLPNGEVPPLYIATLILKRDLRAMG